ncbi:membrane protein insertase YidC [Candidatus Zinderia endosymbiont of Aphrophora alni]|uniref:membrane protein insertase YidC n=1 Tax=Candidatus Zinderia endosymbiont of Aphrophora alni TaxID=3077951 RepID=UPI0030D4672C
MRKNKIIIILSIIYIIFNFNYIHNKNIFLKNKYFYLEKNNIDKKLNILKKNTNNITIITNLMKITLNKIGGDISKIELLKFKNNFKKNKNLFLFKNNNKNIYKLQTGFINKKFPNNKTHYILKNVIKKKNKIKVILSSKNKKIKFLKIFTFKNNSYYIKIKFNLFNNNSKIINPKIYLKILHDNNKSLEETKFYKPFTGFGVYTNNKKFQKINLNTINNKNGKNYIVSHEGWIAFIQHYFTSVLIMPKNSINSFYTKKINNNLYAIGNILKIKNILPKHSLNITFGLYSGPQNLNFLKKINNSLELIKNYGKLLFFIKPIYWLLIKIHTIINNWGWNIILLTIVIKIIFLPITIYVQEKFNKFNLFFKNKKNINQIQLNNNYIKKKINNLYKKEKISFIISIFFIIIQLPFYLSLFTVLSNSIEFRNAHWIFWIKDLSLPDTYFILPIIMSITSLLQSNLNFKNKNSINISSILIAISFILIFSHMPSSIVLYWITNNFLSILQQIILLK